MHQDDCVQQADDNDTFVQAWSRVSGSRWISLSGDDELMKMHLP